MGFPAQHIRILPVLCDLFLGHFVCARGVSKLPSTAVQLIRHSSKGAGVAHVLVAESKTDLQRMIRNNLAAVGHDVTVVSGRAAALAAAALTTPDLCILDVTPLRSGVELCRALRGDPATALSPIIIVTSMMQACGLEEAIAGGADVFLVRPFSPRNLLTHVDALLERTTYPL